jgi:hypothetical protein
MHTEDRAPDVWRRRARPGRCSKCIGRRGLLRTRAWVHIRHCAGTGLMIGVVGGVLTGGASVVIAPHGPSWTAVVFALACAIGGAVVGSTIALWSVRKPWVAHRAEIQRYHDLWHDQ